MIIIILKFLISIIFIISVILFCISFTITIFYVPYVPSPRYIFREIEKLNIISGGTVLLELGCGDAGFLTHFARRFGIVGKGYEISPLLYIVGVLRVFFFTLLQNKQEATLRIYPVSFFAADLSEADIVYCYLFPRILQKLVSQFRTMKHDSYILSLDFPIPGFFSLYTLELSHGRKLYLYKPQAITSITN